jgi:hypothetical protein
MKFMVAILVASLVLALPSSRSASAQPPSKVWRIGLLDYASDPASSVRWRALRDRLRELAAGVFGSYGTNYQDLFRRAAGYVDRILTGAKPADLPIEQPTTFEFVLNMKTAKALGLTISPSVLLRADQVME